LKLLSFDTKQVNKPLVLAPIQVRQPRQKFEGEIEKAKKAYKQKNYRLAHEHITPLVQDGNSEAQHLLGSMYFSGRGVEKNLKEAVRLYRLSAEQDYAPAQYVLANRYANGQGVKKDYHKAMTLYKSAAKQGYLKAIIGVGWLYDEGSGIEEDNIAAAHWYEQAAKRGSAPAQYALGLIYEGQKGVAKNLASAYAWYILAAANGHKAAKKRIPSIAKKMTPKDFRESSKILKETTGADLT